MVQNFQIFYWEQYIRNLEFVVINENFKFVISKSMYEPLSPLKHLFCFIILQKVCSYKKPFITLFSASISKSPRMITFSYRVSRILIDLSNTRENTCFPGVERCKLTQITTFLYFLDFRLQILWTKTPILSRFWKIQTDRLTNMLVNI